MLRNNGRHLVRLLLLGAALSAVTTARADNFRAFTSDSFEQIKAAFAGEEFLLGLWSVDCPPCLAELQFMGEVLKLNPDLPYVLISTDPIEDREFALDFLEDFQLADIESWIFADSFVERLRFSIDPGWYGELPRSYFFDAEHRVKSHSGIVDKALLQSWFSQELLFSDP